MCLKIIFVMILFFCNSTFPLSKTSRTLYQPLRRVTTSSAVKKSIQGPSVITRFSSTKTSTPVKRYFWQRWFSSKPKTLQTQQFQTNLTRTKFYKVDAVYQRYEDEPGNVIDKIRTINKNYINEPLIVDIKGVLHQTNQTLLKQVIIESAGQNKEIQQEAIKTMFEKGADANLDPEATYKTEWHETYAGAPLEVAIKYKNIGMIEGLLMHPNIKITSNIISEINNLAALYPRDNTIQTIQRKILTLLRKQQQEIPKKGLAELLNK